MTRYCKNCAIETERYASGRCKPCKAKSAVAWNANNRAANKIRNAQWYAKNRDQARKKNEKWRSENRERARLNTIAWRKANPEKVKEMTTRNNSKNRNFELIRKYGIDSATYETMFTEQNGVCYLCYNPETYKQKGKVQRLAVDHCHKNGRARRLLCRICNTVLGFVHDDPQLLRRMADYLEEHKKG